MKALPLLLLLIGCASPTPIVEGPPEDAVYDAVLVIDGQAEAGPTRFVRYTSVGACETTTWIEVAGLCDLQVEPDAAGFADLPAEGEPAAVVCRYRNRTWSFTGGIVHMSQPDAPALRIDAERACTVNTALGGPPDPVCEEDVFVRLDLDLAEGSVSGDLPCTLPAEALPDGRCGPAIPPLRCDG